MKCNSVIDLRNVLDLTIVTSRETVGLRVAGYVVQP